MFLTGPWTSSQDYEISFTQGNNVKSQIPSYRGTITSVSILVKLDGEKFLSGFKLLETVPAPEKRLIL